jgi:hypothetical protein
MRRHCPDSSGRYSLGNFAVEWSLSRNLGNEVLILLHHCRETFDKGSLLRYSVLPFFLIEGDLPRVTLRRVPLCLQTFQLFP